MSTRKAIVFWGGIGTILLLFSMTISLSIGTAKLPFTHVWSIIINELPFLSNTFTPVWEASAEQILLKVRLPRIVLAVLVGACLSLAGVGFQGVLRNPLADPYILGVSSGAAVGASFIILFQLNTVLFGLWTVPIVAFLTAMLSLLAVLKLANIQGHQPLETIILSGVVISAFLGAFVSLMVSLSDKSMNQIIFWLMGSLSMQGWPFIYILLPYAIIGFILLMIYSHHLNIFALGERQAAHLGIRVKRTRLIILIISTFITAAAVAIVGTIGFVGLVVPHLVRLIVGPDYRVIIPISVIFGALYVLLADTLARTLMSPTEIPLGVVTAFLGAPFFGYLLRRSKHVNN
ncbi:MAG TPA: iron chelate uptake ABC transporter family permease subunit [Bacillota bacterium]|nr:iron chelate uptake ABC transporter family permease subunit [Bacillota bacterium]